MNNAYYVWGSHQNKLKEGERHKMIFSLLDFVILLQLCNFISTHGTLRHPFVYPNQCLKLEYNLQFFTSVEPDIDFETVNIWWKFLAPQRSSLPPLSHLKSTNRPPLFLHHLILFLMITSIRSAVLSLYTVRTKLTEKDAWPLPGEMGKWVRQDCGSEQNFTCREKCELFKSTILAPCNFSVSFQQCFHERGKGKT